MDLSTNPPIRVLVIDPNEAFGQILQGILGSAYALTFAQDAASCIEQLDLLDPDAILLNLDLPKGGAIPKLRTLVEATASRRIALPVIVYSSDPRRELAVEAFRYGITEFLEQPLDVLQLKFALEAACRRTDLARNLAVAQDLMGPAQVEGMLGTSKAMEQVKQVICKVAPVVTTVLLTGESGTGKGVAASAIHRLSQRADRPFVAFSPSAFPESLIEEELFGHEKGAFTGAAQTRRGRFEEAGGGTIFLDEIGDLAMPLQTKLLRVLQERTVERLGSNAPHPTDIRVICATSRNLQKMVKDGSFREDLYFRISVVRIRIPPLRERREDIPLLAESFLRSFAKVHKKHVRGFTPGYVGALTSHSWPGNVRELQNVIERSLVLANGTWELGLEDLPPELRGLTAPAECASGSFHEAVRCFKRELVRSALRMHGGNKLRAAQDLGISRCYLHRLLNQLGINDAGNTGEDFSEEPETEDGKLDQGVSRGGLFPG